MSKVVLRDGDTVYIQEDGTPSQSQWVGVVGIDWLQLAQQKHRLLHLVWEDEDDILWGLINLIDVIQDQAEEAGHPVVFFHQAGEGEDR
jgi:hypothetical protein